MSSITDVQVPQEQDEKTVVQERVAQLRKDNLKHDPVGSTDPVTPAFALHLAAHTGFGSIGRLHHRRTDDGSVVLRSDCYLSPEQEDQYTALMKGKKRSLAASCAVVAKVLGYSASDVDDLAFLASQGTTSKAKADTLAWTAYFRKNLADVQVPEVDAS